MQTFRKRRAGLSATAGLSCTLEVTTQKFLAWKPMPLVLQPVSLGNATRVPENQSNPPVFKPINAGKQEEMLIPSD